MDEYLFIEVAKLKADRARLERERQGALPKAEIRQPKRRSYVPLWAEWLARQSSWNWNWKEQP